MTDYSSIFDTNGSPSAFAIDEGLMEWYALPVADGGLESMDSLPGRELIGNIPGCVGDSAPQYLPPDNGTVDWFEAFEPQGGGDLYNMPSVYPLEVGMGLSAGSGDPAPPDFTYPQSTYDSSLAPLHQPVQSASYWQGHGAGRYQAAQQTTSQTEHHGLQSSVDGAADPGVPGFESWRSSPQQCLLDPFHPGPCGDSTHATQVAQWVQSQPQAQQTSHVTAGSPSFPPVHDSLILRSEPPKDRGRWEPPSKSIRQILEARSAVLRRRLGIPARSFKSAVKWHADDDAARIALETSVNLAEHTQAERYLQLTLRVEDRHARQQSRLQRRARVGGESKGLGELTRCWWK